MMASNFVCRSCILSMRRQRFALLSQQSMCSPNRYLTTSSAIAGISAVQRIEKKGVRWATTASTPTAASSEGASRPPTSSQKTTSPGYAGGIAGSLRRRARASTETYVAYGATEKLFKECARQADYAIKRDKKGNVIGELQTAEGGEEIGQPLGPATWYKEFDLPCTFNTWAQITFLHMWLLTARFRLFPSEFASSWHQHLLDHFSFDAERRMTEYHGLVASAIRQKYLKDLFIQWRGCLAAYDEGLVKGDAVLAGAVWRNIFGGRELRDGDVESIAAIVAYIRQWLKALDKLDDGEVAGGWVEFNQVKVAKQA